jgi:hypothetical protein
MHAFRVLTYIFSPLVIGLLVGIVLEPVGIWFVLIVLAGLCVSIANGILVSLKVMK